MPSSPPTERLVELGAAAIDALAAGDLVRANAETDIELTSYFVGPDWASLWRRRSRQLADDPRSSRWITRAILDVDDRAVVGRAGYHGPPDHAGMVEIGYAVDPEFRRRGYARAALVALLTTARAEPGVRTVRATISPDNAPSRNLVLQYGFVEVGEQWDDEDGLEIIFEVSADEGG